MKSLAGLLDLFLLRDRINRERNNPLPFIFEKASILLSLFVIALIGIALQLPSWGIGVLVGTALGPVVYTHYYLIYIRPLKKEQNLDVAKKQGKVKRK